MTQEIDERLDREALRRAYEMHRLPLLQLSTLLMSDPAGAEDLVQDVFVRSSSKIPVVPEGELYFYLRRGVINGWKNHLRSQAARAKADRVIAREDAASAQGPEDRDALWAEIVKLPDRQRACVVLRYYEDLSDRDIADLLGCRVGTVKSQSSRGLAKLRIAVER